mmetsp:Transcript_28652/g.72049  ORF Transcript_28652/g.72049 Transcript_28652/m.72049 type:complete len:205 (+) Transcript_28652:1421-2035(+)
MMKLTHDFNLLFKRIQQLNGTHISSDLLDSHHFAMEIASKHRSIGPVSDQTAFVHHYVGAVQQIGRGELHGGRAHLWRYTVRVLVAERLRIAGHLRVRAVHAAIEASAHGHVEVLVDQTPQLFVLLAHGAAGTHQIRGGRLAQRRDAQRRRRAAEGPFAFRRRADRLVVFGRPRAVGGVSSHTGGALILRGVQRGFGYTPGPST